MNFVTVNRTPVLTLWAAVVAESLGFDPDEALTLGKAVAGATAQSGGRLLGAFTPSPEAVRKERARNADVAGGLRVALLGRAVPVLRTDFGFRAADKGQQPIAPSRVEQYLRSQFGESLSEVRVAMEKLAQSRGYEVLVNDSFKLYEAFRPEISGGEARWGAKGKLSLQTIRELAAKP
jgi:hypothetical protein